MNGTIVQQQYDNKLLYVLSVFRSSNCILLHGEKKLQRASKPAVFATTNKNGTAFRTDKNGFNSTMYAHGNTSTATNNYITTTPTNHPTMQICCTTDLACINGALHYTRNISQHRYYSSTEQYNNMLYSRSICKSGMYKWRTAEQA